MSRYRRSNKVPVSLEGIEFDAMLSESKAYKSTIPQYPVETGFDVSDTIILDPEEKTFALYLSTSPVTYRHRHGSSKARVQQICDELEQLWYSKKLIKVVTPSEILTSMGIVQMEIKRTTETGYCREVDITLRKVRVTSKQTASVPSDIAQSGATASNAGTATTSKQSAKSSESASTATTATTTSTSSAATTTQQKKDSQSGANKVTGKATSYLGSLLGVGKGK